METRVTRDDWAGLRGQGDQAKAEKTNGKKATLLSQSDFAIHVAEFDGKKARKQADALHDQLTNEMKIPDVWVWEDAKRAVVYRGRYPSPSIDKAERDLRQTRMLQIEGKRPFESVELMPVGASLSSASTDMDLRKHMGMHTLQIGAYDETFGPDFRAAAERAVIELRKQGNEAYFYHGPNRSLLTIGLFSADDRDDVNGVEGYGARARALQQKFPYNLINGLTIKERVNGKDLGEQPSFLVEVK